MKFFRNIFNRIDSAIRENQGVLEIVLCSFLTLGLLTQVVSFSSILQFRADHRSIVGTLDNDSAWGIETAERTNLLTDNQRRSYGPVWYRVNYLMRLLADNPIVDVSRNDQQNKEKDIYFTLMVLNLISVYLLAGCLSVLFFSRPRYQLMSTLFLAPALLNEYFQALLVIIAKPDHFLSLMVLISFIATVRLLKSGLEDRALRWTAFFWGVTLSTKLTALPFIPVLLMLMYFTHQCNWWEQTKKFLKYLALSYFLIGFPQNFDFWRNLAYIHSQNKQTSWATWQSFGDWVKQYFAQIVRPASLLVLFVLIFERRSEIKEYFRRDLVLKFFCLFAIPFGFMLSRRINEPFFRWYTFPYVAIGLFLLAALASYLAAKFEESRWGVWKSRLLQHPYAFLVLFFALPWCLPLNSTMLSQVQKEYEKCRTEALKTEDFIDQALTKKEHVLADTYAPFSASYEGHGVDSSWEMRTELILPGKTRWIVLKNDYYKTYLTKEEGGTGDLNSHVKQLAQVREFYRLFWNKEQTIDPFGQSWKKIYHDQCGFEVWHQE